MTNVSITTAEKKDMTTIFIKTRTIVTMRARVSKWHIIAILLDVVALFTQPGQVVQLNNYGYCLCGGGAHTAIDHLAENPAPQVYGKPQVLYCACYHYCMRI